MIKVTSNTTDVIKGLTRYKRGLNSKIREFLLKLHSLGVNLANAKIGTAIYAGSHDVKAVPAQHWDGDKRLILEVHGDEVTFIEFGTGVTYWGGYDSHPLEGEVPYSTRGSYGQRKGLQRTWVYKGDVGTSPTSWKLKNPEYVATHGSPANRVVYNTGKELRQNILRIAREVFGNG